MQLKVPIYLFGQRSGCCQRRQADRHKHQHDQQPLFEIHPVWRGGQTRSYPDGMMKGTVFSLEIHVKRFLLTALLSIPCFSYADNYLHADNYIVGVKLLNSCKGEGVHYGVCLGYIAGIADVEETPCWVGTEKTKLLCS